MKKQLLYSLISLLLLPSLQLQAQSKKAIHSASQTVKQQENALFKSEEPLLFRITMDMKTVLKDRGEERECHSAVISYSNTDGTAVSEKLKIMVRGNRRRDPTVCSFPPLMLNFSRNTVDKTVFGKVDKLKLVTHCSNEEYLLREYLVYKLFNIMTDMSFRARLCKVEYVDLEGKRKTETKYGFLLEDDDDMAERNKGQVVQKELVLRMDGTNELAMAKVALFQYMIGNTDWSVPFRHNIKLVSLDSLKAPYPVPYDFDYSGIVSAPYAVPPPELNITSVRQRLFRGYAFPEATYRKVVSAFNEHKMALYDIYLQSTLIDQKYRKQTIKFLDDFYETINEPKAFKKEVVRVGEQNMKGAVVIKGLNNMP